MDIDWHELFEYRDGVLIFKERPRECFDSLLGCSVFNSKYAGKPAGGPAVGREHYMVAIKVNGIRVNASVHRIIWEMFNFPVPEGMVVDHIDQCPANNKIENLRLATRSTNAMNRPAPVNNSSGVKNVTWVKLKNKWKVYITSKKKLYFGGYYSDLELAELVAHELREKIHGEFACHD